MNKKIYKRIIRVFTATIVSTIVLNDMVYAVNGDIYNIEDENNIKLKYTQKQTANFKIQKHISLNSQKYGYEVNGNVYRFDELSTMYNKNNFDYEKSLNDLRQYGQVIQKIEDNSGDENESNFENDLEMLKDVLNRIPDSPIIEIDNLEKAYEEMKNSEIKKLIDSTISDNGIKIEFITKLYKDVYKIKLIKNSASVEKVISVSFEELYTDEEILNSKLEKINVDEVFIDNLENASIEEKLKEVDLAVRNQTWLSFHIECTEKENEFKIVAEYNGIVGEKIIKIQFQELETEEEIINQAVENIQDGKAMLYDLEDLQDKAERQLAVEKYVYSFINDHRVLFTVDELEVGKYKVNLLYESVEKSKVINIEFDESDEGKLIRARSSLKIEADLGNVVSNLVLTKRQGEAEVTWESSNESVITSEGVVNRPSYAEGDKVLDLIATLKVGDLQIEKNFCIKVKALDKLEDSKELEKINNSLNIALEKVKDGVTHVYDPEEYSIDYKKAEIKMYVRDLINNNKIEVFVYELYNDDYKIILKLDGIEVSKIIKFKFDKYDCIKIREAYSNLNIEADLSNVVSNLVLTKRQDEAEVTWESSDESVITSEGVVDRPSYKEGNKVICLIATLKIEDIQIEKKFYIKVKALDKTEIEELDEHKENLRHNFDVLVKKYSDYRYTEESREEFNNFVEENRKKINLPDVTLNELEKCISDLEDKCKNKLVLQLHQDGIESYLKLYGLETVYVDNLEAASDEEKEECIIKYIEYQAYPGMKASVEKCDYEGQYKMILRYGNAVGEKNIKVNFKELETEEEKLANILNNIMDNLEIEVNDLENITDSEKCSEIDRRIQSEIEKINYFLEVYTYVEYINENKYKVNFKLGEIEKSKEINVIFIESK